MVNIRMAEGKPNYADGNYLTLTFSVTQECNLACTYCYMKGKNNQHRMSLEMGKKIVDFILTDEYINELTDIVVFDFIGGEPLLEMDLISDLSDYIVLKMYMMNHKWFNSYSFSFSTNGTLYGNENVRKYISRHRANCNFGFSIDGTKEKHNLTRIKKDGSGSYDDVAKNFELYFKEFPNNGTKSTFGSDDLKYLKDSIIHLWNLGMTDVHSNLVYEDVWKEGDPEIFEDQLKGLADYVIDNDLYLNHSVSYFHPRVGLPVSSGDRKVNRCGAGYKSLAFDSEGNIYPCVHFIDMCLSDNSMVEKAIIGNVKTGIQKDILRSFAASTWQAVSPEKCQNCEVGTDCGWCLAVNLESTSTILNRTTYICEMHKANARANAYFWQKYEEKTGCTSPRTIMKIENRSIEALKYLFFVTSDSIVPHCGYKTKKDSSKKMTKEVFQKGIDFCTKNGMIPVFLGKYEHNFDIEKKRYFEIMGESEFDPNNHYPASDIIVYENGNVNNFANTKVATYLVSKESIENLSFNLKKMLEKYRRVNLFIKDIEDWNIDTYSLYEQQMYILTDFIIQQYVDGNYLQVNAITDEVSGITTDNNDCGAGITSIAIAPDGQMYICPGMYFAGEASIGSADKFNSDYKDAIRRSKSGICVDCKNSYCSRCLYQNKITSMEIVIPSDMQCRVSYLHSKLSEKLQMQTSTTAKSMEKKYTSYIDTLLIRDVDHFSVNKQIC